jgi:ribose 5-phosphate isomerase B
LKSLLIASDHGGWDLKEQIKSHFPSVEWIDLGPESKQQSVDYPDYADRVCSHQSTYEDGPQGILICGSGQGMAMRANKFSHIRAALVWSEESAQLAREHNNANILCLGGRLLTKEIAFSCVKAFLETPFAGGRHQQRIDKLHQLTNPTSHSL